MNSRKIRSISTAISVMLSQGCGLGGWGLPSDFIKSCTQEAMKVQTWDCSGWQGCPYAHNTKVPIDLGVSPAVARMPVGFTGWLEAESEGNNVPDGCLPHLIGGSRIDTGLVRWVTSNPDVVALIPRENWPTSVFVRAVAPGEAIVYAEVKGTGRVDFSHCPNHLDSCVPVGRIVVTP